MSSHSEACKRRAAECSVLAKAKEVGQFVGAKNVDALNRILEQVWGAGFDSAVHELSVQLRAANDANKGGDA